MIKTVAIGLWVCAVALSASVISASLAGGEKKPDVHASPYGGELEHVKTKSISVPMIADGAVQGYIIARFVFVIDKSAMKRVSVKPEEFLLDEAFRAIYAAGPLNPSRSKKTELNDLNGAIGKNVNRRLGVEIVKDVLVEELNYIAKNEARGGSSRKSLKE